MLKKIIVRGPAKSRSGYGEQTRFALRALRSREDLFDIYIINTAWGRTGQISENTEERQWIEEKLIKTAMYVQQQGQFDLSLQVTIPNEFEKIAPVNIGYTAGIETTKVAPQWLQKANETVDKMIVVSNHSKAVFENTKYDAQDQNGNKYPGWGLQIPVEVVNYAVREFEASELEIDFVTSKNFLVASQWGPRKNLENTIRWFIDTFREDPEVGLVVKTNIMSDSTIDREYTSQRLGALLSSCGEKKCKVYLLHGEVSPGQLTWLYRHPTMKALINIGHGEGFGLPLFEAAYNGLPLATVTWSGQMDFICKPNKAGKAVPRVARIDYDLNPVQKEAVWPGVIQEDSMWAFAREGSYKRVLKEILEKETHYKKEAETLQNHLLENFTEEKMYGEFVNCIADDSEVGMASSEIDSWLESLNVQGIE
jgi:glycosyltransferase involved in cell wall biosynthesis